MNKHQVSHSEFSVWLIDWSVFNVSANTV